jgi:hypothetical protein
MDEPIRLKEFGNKIAVKPTRVADRKIIDWLLRDRKRHRDLMERMIDFILEDDHASRHR